MGKSQVMVKQTPPNDSIEKIWKGLWGEISMGRNRYLEVCLCCINLPTVM